jgi:hypothetical protein
MGKQKWQFDNTKCWIIMSAGQFCWLLWSTGRLGAFWLKMGLLMCLEYDGCQMEWQAWQVACLSSSSRLTWACSNAHKQNFKRKRKYHFYHILLAKASYNPVQIQGQGKYMSTLHRRNKSIKLSRAWIWESGALWPLWQCSIPMTLVTCLPLTFIRGQAMPQVFSLTCYSSSLLEGLGSVLGRKLLRFLRK